MCIGIVCRRQFSQAQKIYNAQTQRYKYLSIHVDVVNYAHTYILYYNVVRDEKRDFERFFI